MKNYARTALVVVTVAALVLWLSSASVPGWLLVALVLASLLLAFGKTADHHGIERRWMKSWWGKWKSMI